MANTIPEEQIIKAFGNWAVTPDGLEFLRGYYFINKDRLDEDDWESHMEEKVEEFQSGFAEALDFARQYHSNTTNAGRG